VYIGVPFVDTSAGEFIKGIATGWIVADALEQLPLLKNLRADNYSK
jgi:hypothetical protein